MTETFPHEQEQTLQHLDFAMNHERKLGVLAVLFTLLEEEGEPISYNLVKAFNTRQGAEPQWYTSPGNIDKYLKECFLPGELVAKDEELISSRKRTVYYPNKENEELVSSLTGLGMTWSLDYPEFSVQQMLGSTKSKGQVRAPRARYRLYKYLLEPRDWSIEQLCDNHKKIGYKTKEGVESQINIMREIGALAVTTRYNPTLRIVRDNPLQDESDTTSLIRQLTRRLPEGTVITLNELIDQLTQEHSDIDSRKTRGAIMDALRQPHHYRSYANLDWSDSPFLRTETSRVHLTERIIEPVRDFCFSVDTILDGSERENYSGKMVQLAKDEKAFANLAAKGKRFSSSYAGYIDGGAIVSHISDLLPGLVRTSKDGSVTVQEIRTELSESYGRDIACNGLNVILASMRKRGLIHSRKEGPRNKYTTLGTSQHTANTMTL